MRATSIFLVASAILVVTDSGKGTNIPSMDKDNPIFVLHTLGRFFESIPKVNALQNDELGSSGLSPKPEQVVEDINETKKEKKHKKLPSLSLFSFKKKTNQYADPTSEKSRTEVTPQKSSLKAAEAREPDSVLQEGHHSSNSPEGTKKRVRFNLPEAASIYVACKNKDQMEVEATVVKCSDLTDEGMEYCVHIKGAKRADWANSECLVKIGNEKCFKLKNPFNTHEQHGIQLHNYYSFRVVHVPEFETESECSTLSDQYIEKESVSSFLMDILMPDTLDIELQVFCTSVMELEGNGIVHEAITMKIDEGTYNVFVAGRSELWKVAKCTTAIKIFIPNGEGFMKQLNVDITSTNPFTKKKVQIKLNLKQNGKQ